MRQTRGSVIALRSASWWTLLGALSLCLFAVLIVVFPNALQTMYFREMTAPQLKREFGFDAGYVPRTPLTEGSVFTITHVTPDGILAKAGVRAGDRPWHYHGGTEMSFYYTLQAVRSQRVVLRVLRQPPRGGIVEIPISLPAEIRHQ